jgi:carboxypeptidase family protein
MSSQYRNPGNRCVRLVFLFSLIVVLVGVGTLARAGQEAAEIIGQITDESGAVLPGVTVTATSPSLQVPNVSSITNERGEYRLSQLPIGTYEVTYELQGFQSVRRQDVRLTIGFTAKLDVQLKVGSVTESLTVSGAAPVVDVTATSTQTQLTTESLESVPSSRSGLISLMALAPGVRPNLDVGGNIFNATINFHAFGQNGESWQAIEGIVTTSPNSGNQGGNYWDSNGIDEAQIKTVGSDADTPVRGIAINAVVRTGGNDFHGSGFFAGTNQSFESNPGIAGNPINKRYDVEWWLPMDTD